MNPITRLLTFFLFLAPLVLPAQPLIRDQPQFRNVRTSLVVDPEGDHDNDPVLGFQIGYAQAIYPLDQMVASYGHLNASDVEQNYLLLSIEEHFPISPICSPYGVTSIGYMWSDFHNADDKEGLYGKIAAGFIFQAAERVALFGEFGYLRGGNDLWLDGDGGSRSQNWQGMIGLRFSY